MSQRLKTLAAVAADSNLARVEAAYFAFSMAYQAVWIAILVYAFRRGGAAQAGLAVVVQAVPAAIVAPFAAYAGDRFRRDRVLLVSYVVQAATLAATAAALFADAPIGLVYAGASAATIGFTLTRPVQSSLLPSLTRTPVALTAANVAGGIVDSVGTFVGPLIAAVLLATTGPAEVFLVFAVLTAIGAIAVAGIEVERTGGPLTAEAVPVRRELLEGFATLGRESSARLVVMQLLAGVVVIGGLDILFVAVGIDLLSMGPGGPGLLSATFGIGSVVGAALTVLLVGRRRLIPPIALAAIIFGVPIALVGVSPAAVAVALFAVSGAGRSIRDVAGRTLLQRVAPDEVLARVFGVLEGLGQAGLALGSVVASVLVATVGIIPALIAIGGFAPALVLLLWGPLASVDRSARTPDPEALSLLRSMPLFAPLAPPTLERLALDAVPLRLPASSDVIVQGDEGDRFYVVAEGSLSAIRDEMAVGTLGAGDGFGEIALLRDVPRTATVRSLTSVRLFALERDAFLGAVTGHPQSTEAADAIVRDRMS
jgi:MFS family permease